MMPDRCDQTNVIYQADVHAEDKFMSYYGLTENEFKKRQYTQDMLQENTQMPYNTILIHLEAKG